MKQSNVDMIANILSQASQIMNDDRATISTKGNAVQGSLWGALLPLLRMVQMWLVGRKLRAEAHQELGRSNPNPERRQQLQEALDVYNSATDHMGKVSGRPARGLGLQDLAKALMILSGAGAQPTSSRRESSAGESQQPGLF